MVEKIAKTTGVDKKDVNKVVSAFLSIIKETTTSGEDVMLSGFGVFFVKKLKKKPLFGKESGEGFWNILRFKPRRQRR